jgi:hypothetical protein
MSRRKTSISNDNKDLREVSMIVHITEHWEVADTEAELK